MKFILNDNDWLARHPKINGCVIFVLYLIASSLDGRF